MQYGGGGYAGTHDLGRNQRKISGAMIGLADIDWENGATVRSAVVKYVGKNSTELLDIKFDNEPDLVVRNTSPDSLGPIEIVGCML